MEDEELCWACNKMVIREDIDNADGYCPKCGAPIDYDVSGLPTNYKGK